MSTFLGYISNRTLRRYSEAVVNLAPVIINMNGILKLSVLAVLLSLGAASKDYEFSQKVLFDEHEYTYTKSHTIKPINTDSVEKFQLDPSPSIYWPGLIQLRDVDAGMEVDGNCGGHLGALHPISSEAYCLKLIEVDMAGNGSPKIATLRLRFDGRGESLHLNVPLFKDSSEAENNSNVIKAEPFTSEQLSSLGVDPKTIDFKAPWLKPLLEKIVREHEDGGYVTAALVMSEDKFNELYKSVHANGAKA